MGARGTRRRYGMVLGLVLCPPLVGGCVVGPKKHINARPSAAMPEPAPVRVPQEGEILLAAERRGAQFVVRAGRAEHCLGGSGDPFEVEVSHHVEEKEIFVLTDGLLPSKSVQWIAVTSEARSLIDAPGPASYVVRTDSKRIVEARSKRYVLQAGQRKWGRCDRPLTSTEVLVIFDTGAELRGVTDAKGVRRFSLPRGASPRGTFAIKIAGRRPAVFAYGFENLRPVERVALEEVSDPSFTELHRPAGAGANGLEGEGESDRPVTAASDAHPARSDPHSVRLFDFELSDVDEPATEP